jgi:hypothetical protein
VYMVLKVGLVWEKGQLLVVSAKALAQAQSSYGKAVSPAELCEIGGTCSICQVGWAVLLHRMMCMPSLWLVLCSTTGLC